MTIGYIGMGLVLAALLFGLVPGAPPLNAPKILDISEAAGVIDPAQMQAADVGTVIVRASYGTQADGAALGYVAQLAAGGIPVAALYHDFDPAAPWADQYEVLAAAMRQTSVRRAALRLSEPGLSPASSAAVAAFMARLASEFPLPLTYRHLIQTNAAAWQALGSPAWGAGYELWIVEPGIVTPAPGVPAPWKGWRLWQYTTAADGPENGVSASTVAVSRFNGTGTQFAGWVNLARMQGGSVGR